MHLFAFPLGGCAAQTMTEEVGSGGAVAVSCRCVERASDSPAATAKSWVVFFERQRLAVSRRKIEPRRAGNNDPLSPDYSDGYRFSSPFRGCAAQTMTSCGRLLPMVAVSCRLVERRKRFAIGNGSGRVETWRVEEQGISGCKFARVANGAGWQGRFTRNE